MRIHTLEATGGQVYAEMARYIGKDGKPTEDVKLAAVDSKTKKPVENGARNIWVNETALSTALNTSYFAESVATFAIVMGVALAAGRDRLPGPDARPAERQEGDPGVDGASDSA
jgi:hypothetical protein